MESAKKKLPKALHNLKAALEQYRSEKSELNFLTITKSFEIVIEYSWHELKKRVEDEGLEAPSPKMAVKQAAKLKLISEPQLWLDCIDARNNSVHDYFGISEREFIDLARGLVRLTQKLSLK